MGNPWSLLVTKVKCESPSAGDAPAVAGVSPLLTFSVSFSDSLMIRHHSKYFSGTHSYMDVETVPFRG